MIGLLMPDHPLPDGTAGKPAETIPGSPATAADASARDTSAADTSAGTDEPAPLLTVLGSDDAAVCTDGVCAL
ncbi:hypothetical protein [Streptomyces sp. NPDC046862]|uniref:hypothetical protein n=1 Tax=Streptomyces sp. NPDC046862 TaxID=3154603 RepID=UPI0034559884